MEGNKKEDNSQNKPNEKKKNSVSEKKETTPTKKDTTQDKNDYHVICKKEEGGNYLGGYKKPLVVATLLLFIATGFLYYEASQSGRAAKTAAESAKEAANVAKATLDEYKKEFEEVNRPEITLVNFSVYATQESPIVKFSLQAVNTGKFRATIKYITADGNFGMDTSHYVANTPKKTFAKNELLPINSTITLTDFFVFDNKNRRKDFLNGNLFLFLACDYEYFTDVLKKNYTAHELLKISLVNGLINIEKVTLSENENSFE
jgi:hypothetical protein